MRLQTVCGALAVLLLAAPATLIAQDTTARGVRIGLAYDPGGKPGVVVLPVSGTAGDSIGAIIARDLDLGDRINVIAIDPAAARSVSRTSGPNWPHTLLVVNYDEWGGFYDHVPPPTAPIPEADQLAGNQDGRLGFRTPALLISPWSRRGSVSHVQFDHTSVLKLIEWRWNLAPLTVRDSSANNLGYALDFQNPNNFAPIYSVPAGPFGGICPSTVPSEEESTWATLRTLAVASGFPL